MDVDVYKVGIIKLWNRKTTLEQYKGAFDVVTKQIVLLVTYYFTYSKECLVKTKSHLSIPGFFGSYCKNFLFFFLHLDLINVKNY